MTAKSPTICFLTGTLNAFAGAERMTAVVANALARRGYQVHILSLWDERSCFALEPGIAHRALFAARPSFKRHYLATILGIRRYVKANDIEMLVDVDTMLTLFTLPATWGLDLKRFAWEHCHFDEDLGKPARRLARWLAARFADGVVVLTGRDRQRWSEALSPRSTIRSIPNPLPFPFPRSAAKLGTRKVLAVGRLVNAKGFDTLLSAWASVTKTHPAWHLQIIGEGEERSNLEAQAARLGIAHTVSLSGTRTDMEHCYADASVFCLSSRYEGFGMALLEAMAFGLPIVSTDCETGPRELLRHRENALLAQVDDAAALAGCLTEIMDQRELALSLAAQARADASRFHMEGIVDDWAALLGLTPVASSLRLAPTVRNPESNQKRDAQTEHQPDGSKDC